MNELAQVEKKHGFTLPAAYRSFADRGYVTYPGESYLWVHEAEWLPPKDMLDEGGFWGNPKPGLVAFAFTGGRSLWAWQTRRTSREGEPMIAFCPRDCFEGWWHAPSFLGWLYRISLEYASSMWDDEQATRQNLRRWAAVLREFGKQEWADLVDAVSSRAVAVQESDEHIERSLIGTDEVNERIVSAFGPGYVDAPYIWDVDGEPHEP